MEDKKDDGAKLTAVDAAPVVVPADQLPHDEPEIIARSGPHPLSNLYSDPEWRRGYFRQFTKRQLVEMLAGSGTASLSEASASPHRSESAEDQPSTSDLP